jgi:hypothetical protein
MLAEPTISTPICQFTSFAFAKELKEVGTGAEVVPEVAKRLLGESISKVRLQVTATFG